MHENIKKYKHDAKGLSHKMFFTWDEPNLLEAEGL